MSFREALVFGALSMGVAYFTLLGHGTVSMEVVYCIGVFSALFAGFYLHERR